MVPRDYGYRETVKQAMNGPICARRGYPIRAGWGHLAIEASGTVDPKQKAQTSSCTRRDQDRENDAPSEPMELRRRFGQCDQIVQA